MINSFSDCLIKWTLIGLCISMKPMLRFIILYHSRMWLCILWELLYLNLLIWFWNCVKRFWRLQFLACRLLDTFFFDTLIKIHSVLVDIYHTLGYYTVVLSINIVFHLVVSFHKLWGFFNSFGSIQVYCCVFCTSITCLIVKHLWWWSTVKILTFSFR